MTNSVYLSEFAKILVFLIGGGVFVLAALFVSRMIRPSRPGEAKNTPYESGEQPVGATWVQFNLRFYVLALIFLLFEVEMVFIYPWATVFSDEQMNSATHGIWGWFALGEMVIFILVLAIGLIYAWVHGYLDWIKPRPHTDDYSSPVPPELYRSFNERHQRK